eukprot:m.116477 g.116477  ORF g.116477 m.116477 type:complete len:56 (-) comp28507_c1_seq1:118-285(-)
MNVFDCRSSNGCVLADKRQPCEMHVRIRQKIDNAPNNRNNNFGNSQMNNQTNTNR